jgi:ABC-type spermidine/putrescine transport system permease subunit I
MSVLANDEAVVRAARRPRRRTKNDSPLKYACLALPVGFFALFFLGPLLFLVMLGFWRVENFHIVVAWSFANYLDILANMFRGSNYGYAILQTLYVAVTTAVAAVVVCYPIAMAVVFTVPARYHRLALLMCVAPFWTSYILRVYAWQVLLARQGIINSGLAYIGLGDFKLSILYTQIATRVGLVHYLAPILIIIFYVAIANIDRTLIEAARELGATRLQVFRRVILPLTRMGVILSLSFSALVSAGDVLSGSLLGGGAGASVLGKLPLFANMIIREYTSSTNLPRTAALALILVAIMVAILVIGFVAGERKKVVMR